YTYYADGKKRSETHYKHKQAVDTSQRTISLPVVTSQDKVITYEYDALNRKHIVRNSQTQLQIKYEYDLHDNEIACTMTDMRTGSVRKTAAQFNLYNEKTHVASARVLAAKPTAWQFNDIHPITGLRLSTTDALGHITHFFYDKARRPVLEIGSDGAVT